jgi:hypothetical protein
MTTADTVLMAIKGAEEAFDLAAPFIGAQEFAPLADALEGLLAKVAQTAQTAAKPIAGEVAAADQAAAAAEDKKFGADPAAGGP